MLSSKEIGSGGDALRIMERDNHTELLARSGVYAQLFARQQDELQGMSGSFLESSARFSF